MTWTEERTPAKQVILEKDGWKLMFVSYEVEELHELLAQLVKGPMRSGAGI